MNENELQRRVKKLLDEDRFANAISGRESVTAAIAQNRDDNFWPRLPVDYLARTRVAEAAEYVLCRLHSLELVTHSRKSISLSAGETMYTDLLYCNTEQATFVLLELKIGAQTEREAVTELLAYEQEILNHCPFLSHDDLVFIVIGTEFRTTLDHSLAGIMTWSRRRVLCLRAEPYGDSVRLAVHLPAAWAPVGQGILPANAIATADLYLYPRDNLGREEIECIASTAMEFLVRDADYAGIHGFAMLWEDAMHPEVTTCPLVMTIGVVNPFSFLPTAIIAGTLSPDRTEIQSYLIDEDRHKELASAHDWATSIGVRAVAYLKHWVRPTWEGMSTWRALRIADRVAGPAHLLERRARPLAFDFFGVMGAYSRDMTARTALRTEFLPSTVRPGVDWRTPRLGAALLDGMTLPEVVPMGQWTFGALFELGLRLGRFRTIVEAFRLADAKGQHKLAARLFWAEADLWEPLHALRDRFGCTEDIERPPPSVVLGGYTAEREVGAEVDELANWISEHFISGRTELTMAFSLGFESHAVYDAAIDSNDDDGQLISKIATISRKLVLASIDHLFIGEAAPEDRAGLLQLLANRAGIDSADQLPNADLEQKIAELPDTDLVAMLPDGIVPLVDCWLPQLWHRLVPARLTGLDWSWLRQQVAALRAQGISHPGIMLYPNAEVATVDFSSNGLTLPVVSTAETHVLVSVHTSGAEVVVAVPWTELEAHGFVEIERLLSEAPMDTKESSSDTL